MNGNERLLEEDGGGVALVAVRREIDRAQSERDAGPGYEGIVRQVVQGWLGHGDFPTVSAALLRQAQLDERLPEAVTGAGIAQEPIPAFAAAAELTTNGDGTHFDGAGNV